MINTFRLPDLNKEGEKPNLIAELCCQTWKNLKLFEIRKAYPYQKFLFLMAHFLLCYGSGSSN